MPEKAIQVISQDFLAVAGIEPALQKGEDGETWNEYLIRNSRQIGTEAFCPPCAIMLLCCVTSKHGPAHLLGADMPVENGATHKSLFFKMLQQYRFLFCLFWHKKCNNTKRLRETWIRTSGRNINDRCNPSSRLVVSRF